MCEIAKEARHLMVACCLYVYYKVVKCVRK